VHSHARNARLNCKGQSCAGWLTGWLTERAHQSTGLARERALRSGCCFVFLAH